MESNRFRAAIWDPPKLVATCLSSHLKTICIRRFWARKVQMEVVKYLLENGHLLDKMIIMYAGYFPREEAEVLYRELKIFLLVGFNEWSS
ncbi:unnamed protein product [Prunus armeniaca]|uniref:FBD domain-containing protein n=1 Tax=Prunus armeniaca TaxID=36596 RepID=A0A6J5UKU3_PRUAR|nr:unnamed protein product [Prunus armeniaca]